VVTAAVLAVAFLVPFAARPGQADQAPSDPEAYALQLINAGRADEGKVALRWDSRLADIAQWRSDTQAANGEMAHLTSWKPILDRMDAAGIVYYGYGEVLVLGTPQLTPMQSAKQAVDTWHASASHWGWLSSREFNYVALGVARDTNGWYYWTALLLNGPGPTQLTARMTGSQLGATLDGKRQVTLSWSGEGAREFRLQKRVAGGSWFAVTAWTSATLRTQYLRLGRKYDYRVRARDAAGNKSTWSEVLTVAL
jgi:uncharacterized protein YkwD